MLTPISGPPQPNRPDRLAEIQRNAQSSSEVGGADAAGADRDADGRLAWQRPSRPARETDDDPEDAAESVTHASRDVDNDSGQALDITG